MTGTYRGRSRHRLPRREGARIAGRPGGEPQYVPADMYRCVPTWHGNLAKACQMSFPAVPPGTEFPRKCFRWHLPASYLPRFSCESVPGSLSRLPPATEFPRKRSRWETSSGSTFLPSTCHSVPADVLAVNGSQQAETCTMVRHSGRKKGA